MELASQVARLAVRIIQLPAEDRELANSLVVKWQATRRLDQVQQLHLERLLMQTEKVK